MSLRPVLFVLLITVGVCPSRGQSVDPKTGPIAGTLVNSATGQPIAGAGVGLRGTGSGTSQTNSTDAQGRFHFDSVPFGRYTLQATPPGYAQIEYGASAIGNRGRQLIVASDRGVTGLQYALVPLGAIEGKVVNRQGEPVPKATIACGFVDLYGAPPTMEALSLVTDSRGEFRLPDMPPGRYYVQALPPVPTQPEDRDNGANLPAFYPSAGAFAEAQPIDLAPGQEASGIKIALREAPVFRIRGKVSGNPNGALSDLHLWLLPKEDGGVKMGRGYAEALSQRTGSARAVQTDGSFELRGVERGLYELAAVPGNPKGLGAVGRVVVPVGDRDVEGVTLPVGNFVHLSMRLQSSQSLKNVSCAILGIPLDGEATSENFGRSTDSDGVFTYEQVIPQKYALSVRCRPAGWVVQAARVEGAESGPDVLDAGLDVAGERVVVDLVLSKEAGIVVASVKDKDVPAPGRWLTLIPDPPRPGKFIFERSGWSDEEGHLVLQSVAPGEYRLYAWEQASVTASSLNPNFLERFANQSVKVSVKAGEQVQVEAKTVQR